MIDYDKLREAHELAHIYGVNNNETSTITCIVYFSAQETYQWNSYSNETYITRNIDDLIDKLKELTQPEEKYKDVWYLSNNLPACTKVLNKDGYICGDETALSALGQMMYDSREALIQAQIEYWQSLSEDKSCEHLWVGDKCYHCLAEKICEHESDNQYHYECEGGHFDLDTPVNSSLTQVRKCIKCMEYY